MWFMCEYASVSEVLMKDIGKTDLHQTITNDLFSRVYKEARAWVSGCKRGFYIIKHVWLDIKVIAMNEMNRSV